MIDLVINKRKKNCWNVEKILNIIERVKHFKGK